MRRLFLLMLLALCGRALCEDAVVLAYPPAQGPLATLVSGTVRVEVRVAPDGSVVEASALQPRLAFVTPLAEAAACNWRFTPSDAERSVVLAFEFAPIGSTDERAHWAVTYDEPFTIGLQYLQSTTSWLDRDAGGNVPPRACPLHDEPLRLGFAPLVYGLPSALTRTEARRARRVWRAQEKLFPEANVRARNGGCTVGSETRYEVQYCARCRIARAEFFRKHPKLADYE